MIHRTGLLCLLAGIALAGCHRTDGPPDQGGPGVPGPTATGEFQKFEGTWVVTAATLDGMEPPGQVGQEYTFASGKLTLRQGTRVLDTARVVLDAKAQPKAIDLISDHLREGEPPARFIYEFAGDELRLCRGEKERPTAFFGKGLVVFTLKRKKG